MKFKRSIAVGRIGSCGLLCLFFLSYQFEPNMITAVDHQGIIRFINQDIAELPRERAIGKSFYKILPQEYRYLAEECTENVFQTGETESFEVRMGTHLNPKRIGSTSNFCLNEQMMFEKLALFCRPYLTFWANSTVCSLMSISPNVAILPLT
ncbi:MAG: PAS domain-containing protein [Deltaproteobacteria bacterium]|nr:PAS domain-containing protein [Deltaproteobacteria bacterium]